MYYQGNSTPDLELPENIGEMGFNRWFRDVKLICYLPVGFTLGNRQRNFCFPIGKRFAGIKTPGWLSCPMSQFECLLEHFRGIPALPILQKLQHLPEMCIGHITIAIGTGPGLHTFEHFQNIWQVGANTNLDRVIRRILF